MMILTGSAHGTFTDNLGTPKTGSVVLVPKWPTQIVSGESYVGVVSNTVEVPLTGGYFEISGLTEGVWELWTKFPDVDFPTFEFAVEAGVAVDVLTAAPIAEYEHLTFIVNEAVSLSAQAAADRAEAAADRAEAAATFSVVSVDGMTGDVSLSSTYVAQSGVVHLDSWNDFFAGGKWVTGQRTTSIATTAPVSAGASVIPASDAAGVTAGVQLVAGVTTATQTVYTVQSVDGTDLTIVGTVAHDMPSGTTLTPLWGNSTHLNLYTALATWIVAQGVIVGTSPKVTFLGNSWIAHGGTAWEDAVTASIPAATVVNAGVSGNTSTSLLARFDADVPADSDYVVFNEPGVNDDTGRASQATQLANLAQLVRKCRAIGAVPIYLGHVPLTDTLTYSTAMQAVTDAAVGTGTGFPAVDVSALTSSRFPFVPDADSLGLGTDALKAVTSGVQNTGVGKLALSGLTTGQNNTAVGREALSNLTTGSSNVAVGHNALRGGGTASSNTAVGQAAGASLSTGNNNSLLGQNAGVFLTGSLNTMMGSNAGSVPNGTAANATTSASGQTLVGYQTGAGSPTQASYITAIGHKATATAAGGFAIGSSSTGVGAASTAKNEGVLGTASHTVKIPGRLNVAQVTPTGSADTQGQVGDIATDADYVYVKTAAGWKRAALTAW